MSASSRPLTDRAAFERFKEAHPERNSALKILQMSEQEFVETYADGQNIDKRQAYRIYQTAVQIQQRSALVWVNLKDMASPFLRQTLFNNIPQSFLEQQEKIPGYDRLFGSLDSIECDESRSVLSPAAYFVDLMRFVEDTITEHNEIPDECILDRRRPDLFHLRLDASNTNDLIPYIDLVNEVLETLVISEDNPNAEAVVEAADFPQSLPVNLPLEELRTYLKQIDWDLPQLYGTFATSADSKQMAIQRERLSLSPQEFERLGNSLADEPDRLAAVYGFERLETALSELSRVEVFLQRTGLSRQALNDLVYQDLDRAEVNAGLSRLFFINAADDGLGQLAIQQGRRNSDNPTIPPDETLLNLSAAKLDRIYRFLKLARSLEWSFADLDWALRSLDAPYEPERVLQFDGLNDFVQIPAQPLGSDSAGLASLNDTFTVEAWVNPVRHRVNPIVSRGIDDSNQIHFLLCLNGDGRVEFYSKAPESAEENQPFPNRITSLQTLMAGEFTHVAVTVEPQDEQFEVNIYINGELDQAATVSDLEPPAGSLEMNIGRNLGDITFAGLMKEVRIWSEVRSPRAIADSRYRRFTGFEPNLVGYWPLTETHGIELLDRSPYNQHGIPGGDRFVTQPRWVSTDLVLEPLPQRLPAMGYQFDGVDQVLAAGDIVQLQLKPLTLEAWIQLGSADANPILSLGHRGDRHTQVALGVDEQNHLVFRSAATGSQVFRSQASVDLDRFSHVAVVVDDEAVYFYVNGRLDSQYSYSQGEAIAPQSLDLVIGSDFDDHFFSGVIQEVRLWNEARSIVDINSFLQRSVPPLAPNLIGYWPLSEITGALAVDLSISKNSLYLGGVPQDFQPTAISVDPLVPDLPLAIKGQVLQFDGDQDVLVLQHKSNIGLGRYPCFTLEFWFKPTQQALNPEAPQLLLSQGDGEAGLAIYLERERLVAIAWCANYELEEVQETVLASAETAVVADQWHHIAIVHDETQSLDYIEFRGFLNGLALAEIDSNHTNLNLPVGQRGYRLSPVGSLYLGGIGATAMTRFHGTYLQPAEEFLWGFAGQITDLRLWRQARSAAEIEGDRHRAPQPGADELVAYLPLDEGQDIIVTDRVNGYTGILQGNDAIFMAAPTVDSTLENRYTHYAPVDEAVLDWRNYAYTGLLYVPNIPEGVTTGGLGVTFLSRYPADIDQFYRLLVTWADGQPRFGLDAHPQGVQPLLFEQAEFPVAFPGTWYAFRIEATDVTAESRTRIAVTLWPDNTPQPQAPQVIAYDASDVRITAGTVGLWVAGNQPQTLAARFNTLRVVSLATQEAESNVLLNATFKSYEPGDNPAGWVDMGDRLVPEDASSLFESLDLSGKTVFGTDSNLNGIHSHYAPDTENTLNWSNYTYRGKLRISDANGGIGLTILSRTPEGIDQYYALRCEVGQSPFQLVAHPQGVQPLTPAPDSRLDSGIVPQPELDYFVCIEVETASDRTYIRAKVWSVADPEPDTFQMVAFDDSDIRITAGTVGVWAAGPGTKLFDDLKVLQETLLAEDFSNYEPGVSPSNWVNTGANNSSTEIEELFRTVAQAAIEGQSSSDTDSNLIFGTTSRLDNIHSHYRREDDPEEALSWSNYTYTGRMLIAPDDEGNFNGIGVTFLSRYTDSSLDNQDQYYRLRRYRGFPTFHIAPHPQGQRLVETSGRDTGVNPEANKWYRFLIEVNDTGSRTQIRAKVWLDGDPEPAEFQANTYDDNESSDVNKRRLTQGTVGLATLSAGSKYFDDLKVQRGVYLSADLNLNDWQATGARSAFVVNDGLFVAEHISDRPLWLEVSDLPLLRRPLNLHGLQFDGDRQYLALASLSPELGDRFTLEAWLRPRAVGRVNPILSWGEAASLELDAEGRVTFRAGDTLLSSETALTPDRFTHIAVSVAGDRVSFYVNGAANGAGALALSPLTPASLDVGRSGDRYFSGDLRDLRLWRGERTEFPVEQRYQMPPVDSEDLVAYWSLAEIQADAESNAGSIYALDTSANRNHLRFGGLESARKPTLFERVLATDGEFWQQPRTMLTFSGPDDSVEVPADAIAKPPKRHTIELWVKVNDPHVTHRRQVIYHSGNQQQQLILYVHDGFLYFGGCDRTSNSSDSNSSDPNSSDSNSSDPNSSDGSGSNSSHDWRGTWLRTDRILADRWHHVALVLDGRAEVRPEALRAYLDGKLVDVGDGSQLSAVPEATRLGAAAAEVRFHDGVADPSDTYLDGSVLELRLWDTARTSAEIVANRYATLVGDESKLALWWRFETVAADRAVIEDGSGRDRTALISRVDRLQPLMPLVIGYQSSSRLDQDALIDLATFRKLMERHRQSVEQLAALWHDLRHTGRADDVVFFDRIFNPTGLTTETWGYHDDARRWDVGGQEATSRDRAIRSRLMAALQISSADLDQLVALVSGDETIVEVDVAYLRQLYRLAQTPKVLRLTLRDYRVMLNMLGLSSVESLADLAMMSDRISQLNRIGISVDGLNFLANDEPSRRIRPPYTDTTIRSFADEMVNQSVEFLVAPLTFASDSISELQSANIVNFFKPNGDEPIIGALSRRYVVDDLGAVSDRYQSPEDLKDLANQQAWADPLVELGADVFDALQAAHIVSEEGIILQPDMLDQLPSELVSPASLAEIQAVLEDQNNRQAAITEPLIRYRNEHRNAILSGLAELLGAEPESLQAVISYFQSAGEPLSDPSRLLHRLMAIRETQPIEADLLDYLYRLNKILVLVTHFELTTAEIQLLLSRPDAFSVSDVFRPQLDDLVNLFTFQELKTAFAEEGDRLVELLTLDSGSKEVTNTLLSISGWDRPQLEALMAHFGDGLSYNRVQSLILLQRAFALAEQLRVDIDFLRQLTKTDDLSLAFYRQQADALLPALRALYDDDQWPSVYRPLRDPLAIQRRDALLALAMENIPDDFTGRRSPDLLSEYLLLDVQVSSAVKTSRIVQGTAALQQYVQRCLMNLEKGVNPATIPADRWGWMQNYRVWEANRKVFLYPESYIEPELRDSKTPLFEELEQELMQGDINSEAVTSAYTRYLNRFTEIANLKIVGSYHHKPLGEQENASQDDILYLIGRTQTQPHRFYYRMLVNGTQWHPWQEIDLVVDSGHLSPVYAFGRLFLFWAELTELTESRDIGPVFVDGSDDRQHQTLVGDGITQQHIEDYRAERRSIDKQGFLVNENTGERVQRNLTVFRPSVKYAYLDADQTWTTPQTYLELDQKLRAEESVLPNWQRVMAQRVLTQNQGGALAQEGNAKVLEVDTNTAILNGIPRFDMRRLTWSFWVHLINERPEGYQTDPSSDLPTVTIFEYGDLRATAKANITAIPESLTSAVDIILNYLGKDSTEPSPLEQQVSNLQSGVSEEVNNARDELEKIVGNLDSAINDVTNDVTNANVNSSIASRVSDFTGALSTLINSVQSAIDDPSVVTDDFIDTLTDRIDTTIDNQPNLPAFQTASWKLEVTHPNLDSGALSVDLPYGWHHIALTFNYDSGKDEYEITLYAGSNEADAMSEPIAGRLRNLLPTAQVLSIGHTIAQAVSNSITAITSRDRQPVPISTLFRVQLSEFRLWERVIDLDEINTTRNARLSGREPGLFYVPLNRPPRYSLFPSDLARLVSRQNTLVDSDLSFDLSSTVSINLGRERILLFYGNEVRSIRNNLEEHSFTLRLENRLADLTNYDVSLSLSDPGRANNQGMTFHLAQTNGLSFNDYIDGDHSTLNRFTPESLRALQEQINSLALRDIIDKINQIIQETKETQEFVRDNPLLRNLPRYEASVIDVGNQPGWYILDTGDEQFLVQAAVPDPETKQVAIANLQTAGERIRFEYAQSNPGDVRQQIIVYFDHDEALEVDDSNQILFQFTRLSTFAVHDLSLKLFTQGIDGLLSLQAQQTEELNFESYQPFTYGPDLNTTGRVVADSVSQTLDFEGAYGLYYREIFFHIPFFIANQLNTNQNFGDAQRWYHYIFNPTTSESSNNEQVEPNSRFWRYLPLRDLSAETLRQMLENEEALAEYQNDPFDPHAIARLRINAYQKAIVMKYIDNLLDWADNLFAQDNRESINQAFLLYVLAFNLLGPRPEVRASQTFEAIGSYQGIREAFEETPEFLTDLDLDDARLLGSSDNGDRSITLNQNGSIVTTFCVPENSEFISFWDRVEDRLFKIRHSLNIEGIFRQLALFQPPLDVQALVQSAAAGGRDIGSLLSDLSVPIPHYRYGFMLERAKEMIGTLREFGEALLGALETRDAEQLAILENTHERNILNLSTAIREAARDEARLATEALQTSKNQIQERIRHLDHLISQRLTPEEIAGLALMVAGNKLKLGSSGLKLGASLAFNVPEVSSGGAGALASPVAVVSFGGGDIAEGLTTASEIVELAGDVTLSAGEIVDRVAEYNRRSNEWQHDRDMAQFDLDEIQQQIEMAELQLQIAERELIIHKRQIEQNQEVANFYRRKFTNEALYNWMVSRLSGLYFQAYRLAYDFAKAAERALQYELPTNERFINFGHWDSLRRGLLAGESLLLDVSRMEKFHLDNDSRFQEIEKIVPLSKIDSLAHEQLVATGECNFALTEALFNRDYPGHYFRVIKSLALSIKFTEGSPLINDPFATVNATLTQVGNKTLLDPDINAVRYLMGLDGATQPSGKSLRVNWRSNQQIAISKPRLDNGMFGNFDLNFVFDDRYFPFEGTGAVSNWHLEIPLNTNPDLQQDENNDELDIADVMIHIKYTSKFDRGDFKEQVQEVMEVLDVNQ